MSGDVNDKRKMFEAFDFSNSADWNVYYNKIVEENGELNYRQNLNLKLKWFKRNIDPSFDPATYNSPPTSTSTSTPTSTSTSTSSSTRPSTPHQPPPSYSPNYPSASPVMNILEKMQLFINLTVFCFSLNFYIFLFIPFLLDATAFWKLALICSFLRHLLNLSRSIHGRLPASFSMGAIMPVMLSMTNSQDFGYFLYCYVFLDSNCVSFFSLAPLAIYAFLSIPNFPQILSALLQQYFPNPNSSPRTLFNEKLLPIISNTPLLLRWASIFEIVTFSSSLWSWLIGFSDISLIHLFLLGQFLAGRYQASEHTKSILQGLYSSVKPYLPLNLGG